MTSFPRECFYHYEERVFTFIILGEVLPAGNLLLLVSAHRNRTMPNVASLGSFPPSGLAGFLLLFLLLLLFVFVCLFVSLFCLFVFVYSD